MQRKKEPIRSMIDPTAKRVVAKEKSEIVWGTFGYGCLVARHGEADMADAIVVK